MLSIELFLLTLFYHELLNLLEWIMLPRKPKKHQLTEVRLAVTFCCTYFYSLNRTIPEDSTQELYLQPVSSNSSIVMLIIQFISQDSHDTGMVDN